MTWLRRKWRGPRWRPGLDLANLGLLVLAAIGVKALWDTKVLERWLSAELHAAVLWSAGVLVALWCLLDVLDGLMAFRKGVRRGTRSRTDSARQGSDDAAA